jgi:hypothetical protein
MVIVSMKKKINCSKHGSKLGMGMACIHVIEAIDNKNQVGFYWSEDENNPLSRPDAWCQACEDFLLKNGEIWDDDFIQFSQPKLICEKCWDEAKQILYKK